MNIGLFSRNLTGIDENDSFPLAEEIAAVCGSVYLFTKNTEIPAGSTQYRTFHLALGERIAPVQVWHATQNRMRIFTIRAESDENFPAAVAVILGKLLAEEGIRLDYLHIFSAEDYPAALLCKHFYKIPYIYSVRDYREIKRPHKEITALGLTIPSGALAPGEYYFSEQSAALDAYYVINETGSQALWKSFFCDFAEKNITGFPVVDTTFWSAKAESHVSRSVIIAGGPETPRWPGLPAEIITVEEGWDRKRQRAVLQAAAFYMAGTGPGRAGLLFCAVAAGCIPIVPAHGLDHPFEDEAQNPDHPTGYVYQQGQGSQPDILMRAVRDFDRRPEWLRAMRQRAITLVHGTNSLNQAAQLYSKVYRGLAPVRLPFLAEQDIRPEMAGVGGIHS